MGSVVEGHAQVKGAMAGAYGAPEEGAIADMPLATGPNTAPILRQVKLSAAGVAGPVRPC